MGQASSLRRIAARSLRTSYASANLSQPAQPCQRADAIHDAMPGRTIAIGDIHGCSAALRALVAAIRADSRTTRSSRWATTSIAAPTAAA